MGRVLFLREPCACDAGSAIEEQRRLPLSYPEAGFSRHGAPPGYPINQHSALIGQGDRVFPTAVAAIRAWQMYQLNWTRLYPANMPITTGETVAIAARHLGFWSLNACRIIYVIEEVDPHPRFGFAFGTLPGHVEQGEERFVVEQLKDGSVWFELHAFARARHPLAKLAPPFVRLLQRRFAAEAASAIRRFVERELKDSPWCAGHGAI